MLFLQIMCQKRCLTHWCTSYYLYDFFIEGHFIVFDPCVGEVVGHTGESHLNFINTFKIVINITSAATAVNSCCSANLIESDPVPCTGGERLQRAVENHGINVCAPVALCLQTHQRSLVYLPQLDGRRNEHHNLNYLSL